MSSPPLQVLATAPTWWTTRASPGTSTASPVRSARCRWPTSASSSPGSRSTAPTVPRSCEQLLEPGGPHWSTCGEWIDDATGHKCCSSFSWISVKSQLQWSSSTHLSTYIRDNAACSAILTLMGLMHFPRRCLTGITCFFSKLLIHTYSTYSFCVSGGLRGNESFQRCLAIKFGFWDWFWNIFCLCIGDWIWRIKEVMWRLVSLEIKRQKKVVFARLYCFNSLFHLSTL